MWLLFSVVCRWEKGALWCICFGSICLAKLIHPPRNWWIFSWRFSYSIFISQLKLLSFGFSQISAATCFVPCIKISFYDRNVLSQYELIVFITVHKFRPVTLNSNLSACHGGVVRSSVVCFIFFYFPICTFFLHLSLMDSLWSTLRYSTLDSHATQGCSHLSNVHLDCIKCLD